jgi:hypothetical protein
MTTRSAIVLVALLAVASGCKESFDPTGPYKDRLVVYGVFTAQSDTQFVRVYRTYPQPGSSASTEVLDAQVTVTHGSRTFLFRDTAVVDTQAGRGPLTLRAYVAYGLQLEPGQQYTLAVVSPSVGNASARATALYRGSLITETNVRGDITVRVSLGANARAFLVRMYLEYRLRLDSVTQVQRRVEIPERVFPNTGERIYPRPVSREYTSVGFTSGALSTIVSELRRQYPGNTIVPLRTVFVLTQLDDALYAYYSTANHFPGSGTIRLDEPDFSNIEGGFGVFGMLSQTTYLADTTGNP